MTPDVPSCRPTIIIIDDDESIREAIEGLLDTVGLESRSFVNIKEFQRDNRPVHSGCIVLDVRLPGRSGLDFHEEYAGSPGAMPVIFISAHADVSMSVRAMKAGAIEFLTKPVRHQELIEAVQAAITRDQERRRIDAEVQLLKNAFQTLTPQERRVARLVVTGQLNKQIAAEVGLSEATVKLHRGHVMQKMGARTLIDLLRMLDRIGPSDNPSV
jgi:FixJ family two-component response regulator